MNKPTPVHAVDALDWLHEQGKQRAGSVPELDLEATLRVLRVASDGDEYARITSQARLEAEDAPSEAEARLEAEDAPSEAEDAPSEAEARLEAEAAEDARSDAQMLREIAAGNEDGVRRFYRKYRMSLFRFGLHVLHDEGLTEEMVQETFIKICRVAGNYDASRGPVRGWLFVIARSVAYDIARRPSSRPFLPGPDSELPLEYDTEDRVLTVLTVNQALDRLPPAYGDVMRLVAAGFTRSEIAERLGIPIGTVQYRTARAADALRAELGTV